MGLIQKSPAYKDFPTPYDYSNIFRYLPVPSMVK